MKISFRANFRTFAARLRLLRLTVIDILFLCRSGFSGERMEIYHPSLFASQLPTTVHRDSSFMLPIFFSRFHFLFL